MTIKAWPRRKVLGGYTVDVTRDQAGELGITEWDDNPGLTDLMTREPVWPDLGPDIHGYRTLWVRTLSLTLILLSGTAVFLAGFITGRLT